MSAHGAETHTRHADNAKHSGENPLRANKRRNNGGNRSLAQFFRSLLEVSELDETIGTTEIEDEENNYFSLGGDDHIDLEEDLG